MSVKVSDRYFNRVVFWLSFKSSFYILDNSSLSDVSFVHIFSQSVACLLILLTLSFTEQKGFFFFLNLNEVQLLKSFFHESCL